MRILSVQLSELLLLLSNVRGKSLILLNYWYCLYLRTSNDATEEEAASVSIFGWRNEISRFPRFCRRKLIDRWAPAGGLSNTKIETKNLRIGKSVGFPLVLITVSSSQFRAVPNNNQGQWICPLYYTNWTSIKVHQTDVSNGHEATSTTKCSYPN